MQVLAMMEKPKVIAERPLRYCSSASTGYPPDSGIPIKTMA